MPIHNISQHDQLAHQLQPYFREKLPKRDIPIALLSLMHDTVSQYHGHHLLYNLVKYQENIEAYLKQFELAIYDRDLPKFRDLNQTLASELRADLKDLYADAQMGDTPTDLLQQINELMMLYQTDEPFYIANTDPTNWALDCNEAVSGWATDVLRYVIYDYRIKSR